MLSLSDVNVNGKLVLVRSDLNAPVMVGAALDNPRFTASALTIRELIDKGAKVVVITHQGRKGGSDFISLKGHADILSKHLKKRVRYIDALFDPLASNKISALKFGEVLLLKNLRSYPDELNLKSKTNRFPKFIKQFDLFVNDAFSVSHRSQASVVIPPKLIKSVMGRQFEFEVAALEKLKGFAKRKVFILGGAKFEDYFPLFKELDQKKNKVFAAGILGNLFLLAQGVDLGFEKGWMKERGFLKFLPKAKSLLKKYPNQILTPVDLGLHLKGHKRKNVSVSQAPFDEKIMDIGPDSVRYLLSELQDADFVFMKGPLGFSEHKLFAHATHDVLEYLASRSMVGMFTMLGGGHLSTTAQKLKIPLTFSHTSLSGGALLSYLAGESLPGLVALENSAVGGGEIYGNVLVCLDRDGTLIYDDKFHLGRTNDWVKKIEILPRVVEGIKLLRKEIPGVKIVMVTNQPGIAINEFPLLNVKRGNEVCKEVLRRLKGEGAALDGYVLCDHASPGYVKRRVEYTFDKKMVYNCECIKPGPGMVFDALRKAKFKGNDARIYVVGDRLSDVHTAHNAKGFGILVPFSNQPDEVRKVRAMKHADTFIAKGFLSAARYIIEREI